MPAFLIFVLATVLGLVFLARRISKSQAAGRTLSSLGLRIAGVLIIDLLLLLSFGYLIAGFTLFMISEGQEELRSIPITVHLISSCFALVYGLLLYLAALIIPSFPEETGVISRD